MGGYSSSGLRPQPISGVNYSKSLNLRTAHNCDLVRRYVASPAEGITFASPVGRFLQDGLDGRPLDIKEIRPIPVYSYLDAPGTSTSRFYSANGSYITDIHSPTHLYQIEDRVLNTESNSPMYFDQLPEVKDMQHRLSVLHLGSFEDTRKLSDSKRNELFQKSLRSLSNIITENSGVSSQMVSGDYNDLGNTSTFANNWEFTSSHLHHPSSFFIREDPIYPKSMSGRYYEDYQNWLKENKILMLDPYRDAHNNIQLRILNNRDSLAEHVASLAKSFKDLHRKFELGIYQRHPNFWKHHLFAGGTDRDQTWRNMTSRIYNSYNDLYSRIGS